LVGIVITKDGSEKKIGVNDKWSVQFQKVEVFGSVITKGKHWFSS
jgi:hypothetical protein